VNRRAQFDHYRPADVLRVVDVPRPSTTDGQVLARDAYAELVSGDVYGEIVLPIGRTEKTYGAGKTDIGIRHFFRVYSHTAAPRMTTRQP
jgi:hypothetical protein